MGEARRRGWGGFVGVRNAMEVVWDGSWRVSVGQGLTVAIYPHRDSRKGLGAVWGACRGVAGSGMGQDDAAEDGALRESLWRAMDILREAIPLTEQERAEKIASLERQLARLKKA